MILRSSVYGWSVNQVLISFTCNRGYDTKASNQEEETVDDELMQTTGNDLRKIRLMLKMLKIGVNAKVIATRMLSKSTEAEKAREVIDVVILDFTGDTDCKRVEVSHETIGSGMIMD